MQNHTIQTKPALTYKGVLLTAALLTGLLSCTWIDVNQAGKQVVIATDKHVQTCIKTGVINVSSRDRLIGIKRGNKKVTAELEALARNEAAQINADTIVAIDQPTNGMQSYSAYRCINAL